VTNPSARGVFKAVRFRALPALALLAALAGCGGHAGTSTVVRISASDEGGSGGPVVALEHARPNGREVPLASVLPLVPSPLPPAGSACAGVGSVTISFASGKTVRYGPCRPRSIDLLQAALAGEARQWAAPPAARTRIVGARPAEARALRTLLQSMRPTRISSIGIEPIADPRRWNASPGDVRLRVHAGMSVRGQWEAALLAGRYTAEAGTHGLRPVGIVAGSDTSLARGFEARPLPVAAARRHVLAALGSSARLVELRDEGGGLAVVVRTAHPGPFLEHHGRALVRATREPADYVGVEDAGGALVYAWGGLPYEGILYPRPDLDGCGPVSHSTPAGYVTPPCPTR
jgi:hypothetical protein